jgi:ArsR family transcriptional regulator
MDGLAASFKALSDPARLQILEFIQDPLQECCSRDDGVCACDVETFLEVSQPTVSHHMKILVQAGLVTAEKRGRWVYYAIYAPAFKDICLKLARYQHDTVAS